MTNTKPIFIPLSWVSFYSEKEFIKKAYRICPNSNTRKNITLWLNSINEVTEVQFGYDKLQSPSRWKKPRIVFFNPNVDLFHHSVPTFIIKGVFKIMAENPPHIFFLATANTKRLVEMTEVLPWKPNVWIGARISNENMATGIQHLRQCGTKNRYLLLETALSPLQPDLFEAMDLVLSAGGKGCKRLKIDHKGVSAIWNRFTAHLGQEEKQAILQTQQLRLFEV